MEAEIFFSEIMEHLKKELPFVVYKAPADSDKVKALLQKDASLHTTTDLTQKGFVFAPFDSSRDTILFPWCQSQYLELDLSYLSPVDAELKVDAPLLKPAIRAEGKAREEYQQLVEKSIGQIQAGKMDKVVLSRKEIMPLQEEDPLTVFQDLLGNYPAAFVYCWFHPTTGLWLGATPETLIKTHGLNFQTMALAGTQPFQGETEVAWGLKEKQEQQYVTDSIVADLESLRLVENIKITAPFTSRAGGLLHLRTDITGKFNSLESLGKMIQLLHPTPAVCGLPKEKSREFILQEEGYDREYYTGFLGELNFEETRSRSRNRRNTENLAYTSYRKKTALYVNLRCMKFSGNTAEIFIGGGITADSVPEKEWQETVDKAQTMKRVLVK